MQLVRYRVTSFRSVDDSGWIDVDQVTALIGTNESGKTNLLLPLWKLSPAKGGDIQPNADYPRKEFANIRGSEVKPVFIQAEFNVAHDLRTKLVSLTGLSHESLRIVRISRRYDGEYDVEFPNVDLAPTVEPGILEGILRTASQEIAGIPPMPSEPAIKEQLLVAIETAETMVRGDGPLEQGRLTELHKQLNVSVLEGCPKRSSIAPRYQRLLEDVQSQVSGVTVLNPNESEAAIDAVLESMPYFVYYSNYGNLDSEIYLPHVVDNLKRDDLGQKEMAKARTLKVLFEFVKLEPEEILELGKDTHQAGTTPTPEQIEATAERKKERELLLMSASTELTKKFREWWKQGDYRFRFDADGDHFRIWVSDDKRPEEVELEGRSTGLQWFLSFYLVFLVESLGEHSDCILLLDEPGLSLHPLAQRDLSEFFDALSKSNQLLYTTHSPFLVDADRLDRVRKVYVASDGSSKASSNLGPEEGDVSTQGAGFAVHAAVGLTVAESLLIGCQPVVVEGPSDQHYLTTIKTLLIAGGKINPSKELVFPTAGGTSGVKAIVGILSSRDGELPVVLLDSDESGNRFCRSLREGLYSGSPDKVLQLEMYTGMPQSEIEDLIPMDIVARCVDRLFREPQETFEDVMVAGTPVLPQIEAWAKKQNVILDKGWKVQLAKKVKESLLKGGVTAIGDEVLARWSILFNDLSGRA